MGVNTTVTEGGNNDTYSLVLKTQPTSDVTIALSAGNQITLDKTSLTFSAANWNTPQTVTVSAVDDTFTEGSQTATINHTVSSGDIAYNGLTLPAINVGIQDNDAEIKGAVWNDLDGNALDNNEPNLAGWTVYLDSNNNNQLDGGETSTQSDSSGNYAFANLRPGTYSVAQIVQEDWKQTYPILNISTTASDFALTIPTLDLIASSDSLVQLNFNAANYIVQEDGTAVTEIWVTRIGDTSSAVSATLSFIDGTAKGCGCAASSVNNDFNNTPLTVSFAANETNKLIYAQNALLGNPSAIRIRNDSKVEGDEFFSIKLSNPTGGATIGSQGTATVTILDDESPSNLPVTPPLESPGTTISSAGDSNALSLIGLNQFWQDSRFANIKGQGLSAVIIDTGIDLNHPFFGFDANQDGIADKIIYQYDFADGDTDASDRNNHGSHIASIVSSVAPDANLIVLKVFKDSGSGAFSDLEKALQWVNSNASRYHIASVNLSLGDSQNWATQTARYGIGDELAAIASQNIIISAAAGNSFYQSGSAQGLAYPAIDPSVIAVGAVWADSFGNNKTFSGGAIDYSTNSDRIASFSQRDSTVTEVFAPGILIAGANATGGTISMGGTSQSAPYLTGIATLAQEIAQATLGRQLNVSEFRTLLANTSDLIVDGDDENDNVINTGATFPRLNTFRLADRIFTLGSAAEPIIGGISIGTSGGGTSPLPSSLSQSHTINLLAGQVVSDLDFGNQMVLVNQPPTAVALTNTIASLAENTNTSSRIKLADIAITDDALGTNSISLLGADAAAFELDGTNLFLKAGTSLDYETKAFYAVTVSVGDTTISGSSPVSTAYSLAVSDVNEAPTAVALTDTTVSLAENTNTSSRIKVADIAITDDALGTNSISLQGADAAAFELDGTALLLKAGTSLDFETKTTYAVTVSVGDTTISGSSPVSTGYSFAVSDVNEAPTAVTFANATSSLAENSSTSVRIKVADIIITDDALGTEVITISGADAGSFELDGNGVYLKAGTVLNYEAKSAFAISVSAKDNSLPGSTPVSAAFNLSVANVNEVPGTTVVTTVAPIATPTGVTRQIPVTISGGSLPLGAELAIVPVSGINQESLAKLNQSGIARNSTAVDFVIDIAAGQNRASLAASLDLVAADLLPQLGDTSGRLSSRKLLYYALNSNTGTASPLTYDPITGAGARFYDLTNDGTPDFFALSLIDGGHGDKDGAVNGKIYDSSFAGFVDLSNIGFSSPAAGLLTVAQSGNAAPGAVSLRANLSGRSSTSNHIGYVVLTPDELAGSANLLNDFNWLRGRAKTLFSSLENTDVTLPVNTSFDRDILLINGQSLRFFEVQDASLDQITSLGDSRFRYLNPASFGNGQASFSSSSGLAFSLGILPGDPGLNALIGEAQAQAPVLDLSALTAAQSLQGAVAMGREAEYNSVVGFYRTLDAQGTIVAADGLTRLRPGDLDYGAAALRADNLVNQLGNLNVANNQTSSRSFVDLTGGSFLAPYALVNGNTFFAYGAANGDGISHFRSLGNNLFGLEDLYGGGDLDYDDLVISFNFASLI